MASSPRLTVAPLTLASVFLLMGMAHAQLSANFYASSCPNVQTIVRNSMQQAVSNDQRMAASILRLFFHDCFVNGCDGSVLLADNATFTGEQNAFPNQNSIRGMGVIDTIKANVEASCNATVSCADVLALAARDGVVLAGGPSWTVLLGRRDATTASQSAANNNLPAPTLSLSALNSSFANQGLSLRDMVALSGAHTMGFARCTSFRSRIYNDTNINSTFANSTAQSCPQSGGDNNLSPLDVQTPRAFDNAYYRNLVAQSGLLHSDQELFSNSSASPTDSIVQSYISNSSLFFSDFVAAMVSMGNISPLTGASGEIRLNCSRVN